MYKTIFMGLYFVVLLAAAPASAQKAKDTLRIAANDQFSVLSPYDMPLDEAGPFFDEIYSPIMVFNEHTGKFAAELATAWRRVDDLTLEFDLRDDIVLHSGKKFNADDIIASINYTIDPQTKLRSKNRYTWIKSVEKLGPYKFRAHLEQPYALDLFTFSYRFVAEDSDILAKLENKADYGRVSAVSAGPYKLASYDRNTGFVLQRFDQSKIAHRRAPIGRVNIVPVTDDQTQIAQLLTGGIDVLRNVSQSNAAELAKQPNVEVTPTPSSQYVYMTIDSIGRSGRKEFMDLRVRKAIAMTINREQIAKDVVPGGNKVGKVFDTLCPTYAVGCAHNVAPYPYNVAEAKKLMAEAGYANGLDLTLQVHDPYKDIAVAMAGQLRDVGIRASVQPMTIGLYTKAREEGKLTLFVGVRPISIPDAIELMEGFFSGSRDYWQDDLILTALDNAKKIGDDAERAKVLAPALDRNNTQVYVLPVATTPWVFAHSKDIRIDENQVKAERVNVSDIFWK